MIIYICDDEQEFCNLILEYLNEFFSHGDYEKPDIYTFNSGEQLLSFNNTPDIAILDIQMRGLNGIETARELQLRSKNTIIIMATSFGEYLDDAMDLSVHRYLTKPLDKERFFSALDKAITKIKYADRSFILKTVDGETIIKIKEIVYVEAQGHKAIIYTVKGKYITPLGLGYMLNILKDSCFYQIHRGILINMLYVSQYKRWTIELCNGQYNVPVAQRKLHDFKLHYMKYVESNL